MSTPTSHPRSGPPSWGAIHARGTLGALTALCTLCTALCLPAACFCDETIDLNRDVQPLVKKYCGACHGAKGPKGELTLTQFDSVESMRKQSGAWEAAVDMLRGKLMPPEDSPQPSEQERRKLAASIEALLFHVDCKLEQDPGRVTIRRLNRNEYNNTVRDLLHVKDVRPADDFPADDVGDGFDNIGDVLSLPPLLMEKYLGAAEMLAETAIVLPKEPSGAVTRRPADQLKVEGGAGRRGNVIGMPSVGAAIAKFETQVAGEHQVVVHVAADQAGPDVAKAELKVDGKSVRVIPVRTKRDRPISISTPVRLKRKPVSISVHFINDYYKPKERNPRLRGDRNLYVHWIELRGPKPPTDDVDKDLPDSHRFLITARPARPSNVREAAMTNLRPIVQRAFRRRVSDAEVAPFVKLVEQATANDEPFERGMQVAITAILVSPQFLFRVERDAKPNDPESIHKINQFELASRLSYFLWSSMPDDRLFLLAAQGYLDQDEILIRETKRMLLDPRASQLAENFAGQWLNLRNLDESTPDPRQFGSFNRLLREDMKRETLMFFTAVVRENRSLLDFVRGDFTFVNDRLAKHYGMPNVRGFEFRRVPLPDNRKVGILGHASILTLTSNPTRTSPVKRGKWIMDNILGTPPPEPPADVPELEETAKSSPNATLRQQLELHRKAATCAVCHRQMDALGFGLENFDAIGRWRDVESNQPIDSAGELPGGERFKTPTELGAVLARKPDQIARSVSERMMTYAIGRGLNYYDRCAVDKIVSQLETNDYRFFELVRGIVLSDPFRKRRGEGAKP